MEFNKRLRLKKRSDFGVEFKTLASDGIIFYIADEKNSDFIALFVKNGKLIYGFNCGSGPVYIESPQAVNDGRFVNSFTVHLKKYLFRVPLNCTTYFENSFYISYFHTHLFSF